MRMQAWVYFVTWIQYAANHITRKCYTNVKNVMIKLGLSKMVLGRMDAGFMFTYAFGAPLAGQLGDMYDPSMVLGVGLYGSAACIFMLIFGMWNHLGEAGPFIANTYFLGVYLVSSGRGDAKKFKGGVFSMATKTGCPIVPITIVGAFKTFPPEALMPYGPKGNDLEIHFHPPIQTTDKTEDELLQLTRDAIASKLPPDSIR